MEPKNAMNKSMKHLLLDLDRIGAIVRAVEGELDDVRPSTLTMHRMLALKEKLNEVHARLDGVRQFVINCQRQTSEVPVQEEMEVWL